MAVRSVRSLSSDDNLVMDVKLKNGEIFKGCDITTSLLGQHEQMVSIWVGDKIRMFPMCDVEFCEMYELIRN